MMTLKKFAACPNCSQSHQIQDVVVIPLTILPKRSAAGLGCSQYHQVPAVVATATMNQQRKSAVIVATTGIT